MLHNISLKASFVYIMYAILTTCSLIYCIRKKEGTIFHFHLTFLFSGGSKITINGEGFSNVGSVVILDPPLNKKVR
jgi:hypothetical protein